MFYDAGAPHTLVEPRALQAVVVPYPGTWPALQPLRLVVEAGDALGARVVGRVIRVTVPPGEQVRVALSTSVGVADLDHFGLWRSHLARARRTRADGSRRRAGRRGGHHAAAASGWTWWLTPSVDVRLVHAVPAPARCRSCWR